MRVMPMVKGVAAGAAVGTVCWIVSKSSKRQRSNLKRNAGKTVRSFITVLEDISDMI
ncbi:MAG: hypothetical protein PUE12_03980 [Oscillospiraceae bacterium]|nr:hypothetical protein [Oscillospiraceae bacterium]